MNLPRFLTTVAAFALLTLTPLSALAWESPQHLTVVVPARNPTTATSLVLDNRHVTITADGHAHISPTCPSGPNGNGLGVGVPCGWNNGDQNTALVPTSSPGTLLVKIGSGSWQVVGTGPKTFVGDGPVVLGFNDCSGCYGDNSGHYTVTLTVKEGDE
jgi:hypothetical protein